MSKYLKYVPGHLENFFHSFVGQKNFLFPKFHENPHISELSC